jgi:hypothetical protein
MVSVMTCLARTALRGCRVLVLAATSLVATACWSPKFFPNEHAGLLHANSPRAPEQIVVVLEGEPSVPFRKVGSLSLSLPGPGPSSNLQSFIEAFRTAASAAGADGIMSFRVIRGGGAGSSVTVGSAGMATNSGHILEMTAQAFVLVPGGKSSP